MSRLRTEGGFLMIELVMTVSVITIALTALVAVFSSTIIGMRESSEVTTGALLADAQMETFRAMTSRDIGLDLSAGTIAGLDSIYEDDPACANAGLSTTCAADGVDGTLGVPTGTLPDSCATINAWYPTTDPCTPSRTVGPATTPASPDGHTYRVDTYVIDLPATSSGTLLAARKEVTVVVRDGSRLSRVFARETSDFDCSTGAVPSSTDC